MLGIDKKNKAIIFDSDDFDVRHAASSTRVSAIAVTLA